MSANNRPISVERNAVTEDMAILFPRRVKLVIENIPPQPLSWITEENRVKRVGTTAINRNNRVVRKYMNLFTHSLPTS